MMYVLYAACAVLSLIIDLFSRLVLNWIVAAFADTAGNLPRWCSYFQTFDATLDEGMYARQREVLAGLGGTEWADFNPAPATWFQTYLNRAKWLLRNSGYGFDYYLFGESWISKDWTVLRYEQVEQLTFIATNGNGLFNIHVTRFGLRFKLGWKAWNYFDAATGGWSAQQWGPASRVPFVFSISFV